METIAIQEFAKQVNGKRWNVITGSAKTVDVIFTDALVAVDFGLDKINIVTSDYAVIFINNIHENIVKIESVRDFIIVRLSDTSMFTFNECKN